MDVSSSKLALDMFRFFMFTIFNPLNKIAVSTKKLVFNFCFFGKVFNKRVSRVYISKSSFSVSSMSMIHLQSSNIPKTTMNTFTTKKVNNKLQPTYSYLFLSFGYFLSIFRIVGFKIFSHVGRMFGSLSQNLIRIIPSPLSFPKSMMFFFIHNGHYNINRYTIKQWL